MKLKKIIVMLLAIVMIVSVSVAGTLAWLTDTSDTVENTFVAGNIGELTLTETDTDTDAEGDQHSYPVIPGVDITKDPKITFTGNTIPAYVFLKIDASDWTVEDTGTTYIYSLGKEKGMSWTLEGWTKLENETGVYYKTVVANNAEEWAVIKGNTIAVSNDITASTIGEYNKTLTFKAYAIQQADGGTENKGNFTPAEAWAQVKDLS